MGLSGDVGKGGDRQNWLQFAIGGWTLAAAPRG
jgi:hypothetical protein